LIAPFILNSHINKLSPSWNKLRRNSLYGFPGLLFVINSVEGLDRFSSKYFIIDAGNWFQISTPVSGRLITNSTQFTYYSGRYQEAGISLPDANEFASFISNGQWCYKGCIVAQLPRKDQNLATLLQSSLKREPVREFFNQKCNRMLIYYTADD
jgi:hypothetical protein